MTNAILRCHQVAKYYQDASQQVKVLDKVTLAVSAGDMMAIVGPSGSGKSTLLHLLGGLDHPSQGEVALHGQSWQQMSEATRCQERNRCIGFVYQFHHLLPEFTALENVMMPLLIAGCAADQACLTASDMLSQVGLAQRLTHRPSALSGGERQRVAIARAVVTQPEVVLADEPTGNLDRRTAQQVFALMSELNQGLGMAWVIVTHDQSIANQIPQCFEMQAQGLVAKEPAY